MTYQETLDFLYKQLPVFHKEGASAYKKDLTRTLALLQYLDNPHKTFKCIHVAGTNGKGSSSHFLASVLQEAGYKTGLYTSPHIIHFGERIRINGQFIEEDFVVNFVQKITTLLSEIQPSFFELTVALAFQYFAVNEIDIAVVEAGLGGRLDSTNVINPVVSLITNISYDHADLLGDTLEKIAFEKAGIIKQEVPVVVSERQDVVENVFIEKASGENSPLFFASDSISVRKSGTKADFMEVEVLNRKSTFFYKSGLTGSYQLKNIAGVLKTLEVLNTSGIDIPQSAISKGLEKVIHNTGLKGRWQKLSNKPLIICDIAHNEAGIREVIGHVNELMPSKIHIVIGMVKDKDILKVLQLLPKDAHYYFTNAQIPRALLAEDLKLKAIEFGLTGNAFANVNLAIAAAKSGITEGEIILVCGSAFVIAEIDQV